MQKEVWIKQLFDNEIQEGFGHWEMNLVHYTPTKESHALNMPTLYLLHKFKV